jgi:hypothetical protein
MTKTDDLANLDTSALKVCVLRQAMLSGSSEQVTGVFLWEGRSWRTAKIVALVKQLPSSISDKDLSAEYRTAMKARKARKAPPQKNQK